MRVAVAILLATGVLAAQSPYGRISGRVTDSADALVAGAAVRAVHLDSGVGVSAATNAQGLFELLNLIPGTYRVTVEHPGFKRYERTGVEVRLGDAVSLNITLELGPVTESVTVAAETPLVEATAGGVGHVLENREILDLPVPGQSLLYLMLLTPGMMSTEAPTYPFTPNTQTSANIAAVGARTRQNEFSIDGIPNMTQGGGFAVMPPPEIVQEVRVQTAPFDASVGRFTGAQVNMALKSGTNRFRADVVYTHMPYKLMAIDFFTNRSLHDLSSGPPTPEKVKTLWPEQSTKRFRATPTGPVLLPRLYDGRNRTFWTFGVDVMKRVRSQHTFFTVPNASQKNGDFSGLLALGAQYQIYDPATIQPAAGGRFSRQPFPGNLIPPARIDPAAKIFMGYYPAPNVAGTSDGRQNFFSPNMAVVDYGSQFLRFDHSLSPNNRIYVSSSWMQQDGPNGVVFHNQAAGYDEFRRSVTAAVSDVMTLRPNLILELRYGASVFRDNPRPASLGFDLNQLGMSPQLVRLINRRLATIPRVSADSYSALGDSSRTNSRTNYHTAMASATLVRGTHSVKWGGEFRVLRENNYAYGNVSPSLTYSTTWTRGPLDTSGAAPIGQGLASMLLGLPTSGYIDRNDSYAEQSRYLGLFFQDDWRLTRRLSLNLGLRYEVEFPTTERFNRSNRGYDFKTPNPIENLARANYAISPIAEVPVSEFRTTGGILFAAVGGTPRTLWNTDRNNFAPRFGLAYQLGRRTVLRGGYGIFYDSLGVDRIDVQQLGFDQRTSLVSSLDNGLTFIATTRDPFPNGILEPAGASLGLRTYLGRSVGYFWPDRRNGYMQRWSFGFQREVMARTMVQVNYVGNRGTKLGLSEDWNAIPARFLSTSPVRDQERINRMSLAVANPFFGIPEFAGSTIQGRTVALNQLVRAFPHFTAVTTTSNGGFSWYQSLQSSIERRMHRGFSVRASHTWSKNMEAISKLNASDMHPVHSISDLDRPHRIVASWVMELPFGRGKRWLSGRNPLSRYVLGGWSAQGIYQWQIGPPLSFGNIIFYGKLADIVLPGNQRKVERWFNTDAGFERDSRRQLDYNIRTFPPRLAGARAPGYNNLDLSMFKSVTFKERYRVQFRAEALDATNSPMFGAPNTSPTSTEFGRISTIQGVGQRKITLGAKLQW